MERAVEARAPEADLLILAAAVADFRPRAAAPSKIKRGSGPPALDLEPTPDVLQTARRRAPRAVAVAFAAETEDLEANARAKLEAKGVDFLVANDVSRADIGFGSDANEVVVLRRGGAPARFERRAKTRLAADLLDLFSLALAGREPTPVPLRR